MHLLFPATDAAAPLEAELLRAFPAARIHAPAPTALALALDNLPDPVPDFPPLAFARQLLPDARPVSATSIRAFADLIFESLVPAFPENQPWRLHILPRFAIPGAGARRCELIHESLRERLQRQRRHFLRRLEPGTAPFSTAESLAQLVLTEPDRGFLSLSIAPGPHRHRHVLSPFPLGEVPIAVDKAAPCRAFAKLVEAELRLGRPIAPGETCVDLGASPGSWSYVALQRGARVTAVDRSELRPDLMRNPRLRFHRGDAFAFAPDAPVDWLLCDVIAAPDRSIDLVLDWSRRRLCRSFVVTLKFKGTDDYPVLDRLKTELPTVADAFLLTRLCANKNEVCVAGHVTRRWRRLERTGWRDFGSCAGSCHHAAWPHA